MRGARGFTMLELIVVLGIFAVLSVMAYGGLNSVLSVRTKVQQAMDRTAEMQKAYVRLRDDLQELSGRGVRDGTGLPMPAFQTNTDGSVEFTRAGWRNPLLHARPTMERVAYRVDDKKRLIRAGWPMLDRAPDAAPNELTLLTDVDEIHWRFLDDNMEWQAQWPKADAVAAGSRAGSEPPPRAVEVTLTTRDWGDLRFLFTADVHGVTQQGAPPGSAGSTP